MAGALACLGPLVYFSTSGTHTVRIQPREDGLSMDQIVLSPQVFVNTSPGAVVNDNTICRRAVDIARRTATPPNTTQHPPTSTPAPRPDTPLIGTWCSMRQKEHDSETTRL